MLKLVTVAAVAMAMALPAYAQDKGVRKDLHEEGAQHSAPQKPAMGAKASDFDRKDTHDEGKIHGEKQLKAGSGSTSSGPADKDLHDEGKIHKDPAKK